MSEPLWDPRLGEPPWDLTLGQQVWDLHRALVVAAADDTSIYATSPDHAEEIRMDAGHRDEDLALISILANASPNLPPSMLSEALRVGRLVWDTEPLNDADDDVRAWLSWTPNCGEPPPYRT